jgi:formylglycine-generating enzyme required for sulfatase activity
LLVLALVAGLCLAAQAQRTATAAATVINGFVVAITVTDGGAGYTEAPTVTISGGGGSGATATALVSNGAVSLIIVLTAGSGYSGSPDVIISAPYIPPVDPPVLALQMVPLVTILGSPGDTNQIETATTLGAGAVWIPLTNVVLTSSVYEWYDRISPPGVQRFYRAVQVGAGARPTPGQRFVWLPAGTFTMGSPASEQDRYSNEGPQTLVTLTRGFWMGRYEVTQGEYLAVMGSNPSYVTGDTNRPVENVSWYDATNYCAKLTVRERAAGRLPAGWEYRLPTEAQWEYACRAGSTNRFSYGDDPGYTELGYYAWYTSNSIGTTHAVGGKLPNLWGLYDMSGNVWEWCLDWYGTYPGGSVTNPQGPATGSYRVYRGGSWNSGGSYCTSSYRDSHTPSDRSYPLGFRVALVAVP